MEEAENVLLELADYVYGHTSLKPMSKALFLISRCLLVSKHFGEFSNPRQLCKEYAQLRSSECAGSLNDDFDFDSLVKECDSHIDHIARSISRVRRLTVGADCLGLVFNTLLRGKFEGGEGLGTFLTPEEVVNPVIEMLIASVDPRVLAKVQDTLLFGDICGGTGRFVYSMSSLLARRFPASSQLSRQARLFDQSSLAVDMARINFLLDDNTGGKFQRVGDSLIDSDVSATKGKFALLATNPPFGSATYRWNLWLEQSIPKDVLSALGLRSSGDSTDPSALFFFRNMSLLAHGGALAIVLPDGVIQGERFRSALDVFDQSHNRINLCAVISLPVSTFSLGGTVAKTSVLVVSKGDSKVRQGTYSAAANHIGFLKRGNRRRVDVRGNDLDKIARDYTEALPKIGKRSDDWRDCLRLSAASLTHRPSATSFETQQLVELCEFVRRSAVASADEGDFHLSVLDVDDTGLIDVVAASFNRPISSALACQPGDIVVSCINPRKWRVAVVPELEGRWTCSSEFVVLRPRNAKQAWAIGVALHHESVMAAVQAKAGGTSSSRQRVSKGELADVNVPINLLKSEAIREHQESRIALYRLRLREARAFARIHKGELRFLLE
jgi:hypothetical protein